MKLNIGCGNNHIEGYINIDIDASCDPDMNLSVYDLTKDFYNESIERICMIEVLEHLENPFDALNECFLVLEKDGVLSGSIPNIYHYMGFLRFLKRKNWKSSTPEHINAWRLTEFQNLVNKVGFELFNYYFFNTHYHTKKKYEFIFPKCLRYHSVRFFLKKHV